MTCFFFLGIYRILSLTFQNIALWCLSDDELFWVPRGGGGGLVAKLCPTLCNPMDWSLPGSSVCGILQTRMLEWVAMPSTRGSSWSRDRTLVSCITGRFFTIWGTLDYLTGPNLRILTNRMFHNSVKKRYDYRMWIREKCCEKPLIHHDWLWRQKGLWAKEGRCLLEAGRLKETFFQGPPEGAQPC